MSTNATTELAKERSREAAERTLTSWIGSCLTLIGLGFALDRVVIALSGALPGRQPLSFELVAPYIALSAVGLGIFLLALAAVVHWQQLKAIEQTGKRSVSLATPTTLATAAVLLFGLIAAVVVTLPR